MKVYKLTQFLKEILASIISDTLLMEESYLSSTIVIVFFMLETGNKIGLDIFQKLKILEYFTVFFEFLFNYYFLHTVCSFR